MMKKESSTWKVLFFTLFVAFYVYGMLNSIAFAKGSNFTILANAFIFVFLVVVTFIKVCVHRFLYIYMYLLFLLILIIATSSNFQYSIKLWVKYSMGLMCLPLGFEMFTDKKSFHYLWNTVRIILMLFFINYFLSNEYGWGEIEYGEGITIGNMFDDSLHTNICILAIFPLFFLYRMPQHRLFLIISMFSVALIVVTMKRTAIVCLLLTMLSFAFLLFFRLRYGRTSMVREKKYASFMYIILALAIFGLFIKFFYPVIMQTYERRTLVLERQGGFENEGRVLELKYIYEDIFNSGSVSKFLLGKETFNTVGTYADGAFGDRMIHNNIGIIINGTGVIGLIFYLWLNIHFLTLFVRYSRRVSYRNNIESRLLCVIYIALWVTYNVASLSGTIWQSIYPMFHFLLSGMILGYFYRGCEIGYLENNYEKNIDDRSIY